MLMPIQPFLADAAYARFDCRAEDIKLYENSDALLFPFGLCATLPYRMSRINGYVDGDSGFYLGCLIHIVLEMF